MVNSKRGHEWRVKNGQNANGQSTTEGQMANGQNDQEKLEQATERQLEEAARAQHRVMKAAGVNGMNSKQGCLRRRKREATTMRWLREFR